MHQLYQDLNLKKVIGLWWLNFTKKPQIISVSILSYLESCTVVNLSFKQSKNSQKDLEVSMHTNSVYSC